MVPERSYTSQKIADLFVEQIQQMPSLSTVLSRLLTATEQFGLSLYGCGGTVRGAAMAVCNRNAFSFKDFDFLVEGVADQQEFNDLVVSAVGGLEEVKAIDHVGKSFAVWKVKIAGVEEPIDLALARTESSYGSHHRQFHVNTDRVSALDDSSRRDFTVNAMFVKLAVTATGKLVGEFFDPHHGLHDLEQGLIRAVGKPEERFVEDPLRMLRAIRFCATLPGFRLDEHNFLIITQLVPDLLPTVSEERLMDELAKALAADPHKTLQILFDAGILESILPELSGLPVDVRHRTADGIRELFRTTGTVAPHLLFAALLIAIAEDLLSRKFVNHMSSMREGQRFFCLDGFEAIARRLRFGGVKKTIRLCQAVLQLAHLDLLENADAVLESILDQAENVEELVCFYESYQRTGGRSPLDLTSLRQAYGQPTIDFGRIITESGIPPGPASYEIKLSLRQSDIRGELKSESRARDLAFRLYSRDTHLIATHIDRLKEHFRVTDSENGDTEQYNHEIRRYLFTMPVLLLKAYRAQGLLPRIFPELAEAEKCVRMTLHHFSGSFLNHTFLCLSILSDEEPSPSPVQILATLFLNIGMTRTMAFKSDGSPTYYRHNVEGAKMAEQICRRLGVDNDAIDEIVFIIQNHSVMIQSGAAGRVRRLMETADMAMILDLLLLHKIEQTAKMKVVNGKRVDQGQLSAYNAISSSLYTWHAEIGARQEQEKRRIVFPTLLTGRDLMTDNPHWGPGLPQGNFVGQLKNRLVKLQRDKKVSNKKQAEKAAGSWIILYHLSTDPHWYLGQLKEMGLLGILLPEFAALEGLKQTSPWHQEDAYTHTLNVIAALPENASREVRIAAVFHDIGKPATRTFDTDKGTYHFYQHEHKSCELFTAICKRFGWSIRDLDLDQVTWLIRNHIKIGQDWTNLANPHKALERLLFKEIDSVGPPSPTWRRNLLVLRQADIQGAVASAPAIQEENTRNYARLEQFVAETEEILKKRRSEEELQIKVKSVWNGREAQRFFTVSGRELGKLVRIGQEYVRDQLAEKITPTTAAVALHVRKESPCSLAKVYEESIPPRSITLTVGLPACGKTSWALNAGFGAAISLDDCRHELWGDYARQEGPGGISALLALQEAKIRAAIADLKTIVVHNTHHLRDFRRPIVQIALESGYRVRIAYFDVDPEECRRRNRHRPAPVPEAVMDEFIERFEKPREDEAEEVFVVGQIGTQYQYFT